MRTGCGELDVRRTARSRIRERLASPIRDRVNELDELTDLADTGALMPPKTNYFAPKPCAGIFLRP